MSRRRKAEKRELIPDSKYNDIVITKFANSLMLHGKKSISEKLLFISGQLPIDTNGKIIKGKIGNELNLADGQKASGLCVINILAQAKKALNGDLDKIKNCIKITGFVNSTDNFTDQPKVINPASETLSAVFGSKGKHTRRANARKTQAR